MNNFTYEANGITFANIKSRLALLLVLLVLLLSACSQKSNQGSVSNEILSAPLPEALLTTAVVFDSTNLLVELKVDGGEPQACTGLSVDQVNKTFSCSATLSAGAHTLILIYSVIDATFGTVKVAETTSAVNVTIVSGQSAPADFSSVQLRILDDDEDGITNLDELDEGSDPAVPSYYVGGTVSGLLGSGAVIQLNGGNDLALLSSDGSFNFIPAVADDSSYTVTVLTQPSSPSQTCSVADGSGTVNGADVTNVIVTCAAATYTVGGTVTGLAGSGLVLQNNAGDDLPISLDGDFTFATALADGSPYVVTVLTQPVTPNQICSVTSDTSSISGANVTNVIVTCEASYTVAGTVTGLAGSGLILQNNAADDLPISSDGGFTFGAAVADGNPYAVTVLTQPSSPNQICSVNNGSGTVSGANVANVTVKCVTVSYSVGGAVTGLAGSGLVLQNNAGDDLPISADSSFTFDLLDGSPYVVTVLTQPSNPSQTCSVTNGSGTVSGADVTDVTVKCVTVIVSYTVGGTVIGLAGSGLVLQNNAADDLPISLDGNFTFATAVVDGGPYAVTVLTQPVTPNQTCSVTRDSGTINGANVVDVQVMCSCVLGTSLIGSCTLE